MSDRFDYDSAEADLYDSGCPYADEIYGYRTEKGINEFMRENGLDPERYYDRGNGAGSSGGSSSNNGGCYLTTACVTARGMEDDCYELNTLRAFRDTYLKGTTEGRQDIAEYYRCAPRIVEHINKTDHSSDVWNEIYEKMISPCVSFIEAQQYKEAHILYKSYMLKLISEYEQ